MCETCPALEDEAEHLRKTVQRMREQIALLAYELEATGRETMDLAKDARDVLAAVCK